MKTDNIQIYKSTRSPMRLGADRALFPGVNPKFPGSPWDPPSCCCVLGTAHIPLWGTHARTHAHTCSTQPAQVSGVRMRVESAIMGCLRVESSCAHAKGNDAPTVRARARITVVPPHRGHSADRTIKQRQTREYNICISLKYVFWLI